MVEQWCVYNIFMRKETYEERDRVLLDAVKPAIDELEDRGLIQTAHFLFEPNFEILFRVRLSEGASMDDVKAIIEEKLQPIDDLCNRIDSDETYHGEGDPLADWSFGTEGWVHTQKFLEYGSKVTLLMREIGMQRKPLNAGRRESQFNIGKLIHCFLNQAGLNVREESDFHIDRFIERSLRAYGYFDVLERLKTVEAKLAQQLTPTAPQHAP
jgi:hypothetical protein